MLLPKEGRFNQWKRKATLKKENLMRMVYLL